MNIHFNSIDIENFRSIQRACVELSSQGTVIVKGVNEYEDLAMSNGSGKSSIFEAIIFALFEETSSGEKDVANRIINDGYTIKLNFDIDNTNYIILRQCKNNKTSVVLYKDGQDISARNKTDTNKLIAQIIGINKAIFLDSVFLSQNANTNLASLTPTARKERLEILTNTDSTINDFKDKLKEQQVIFETKCVENQMNINKLNGNKETLNLQKVDIQFKINEVDKQIAQRNLLGNIDVINNELEVTAKNIEIQQTDLSEKEKEIDIAQNNITEFMQSGNNDIKVKTELVEQYNAINKEIEAYKTEINLTNFKITQSNNNIDKYNKEIDKIRNSDTCPTCGRKYDNVNEEHITNVIQEFNENIADEQKQQVTFRTHISELQTNIDNLLGNLQNKQVEIENINLKINEFNSILAEKEKVKQLRVSEKQMIANNIMVLNNRVQELQQQKDKIQAFKVGNKEEFENMLVDINDKLSKLDIEIEAQSNEYNVNNDYVLAIKHSIQMVTKEFRTYLLQNSLQYLNTLLKQYSTQLFSNDKDIIQIEEDDTKLNISLGTATYESLSGGEKTRVNIALLLAQKSLANIIGNMSCNIIILDEILGYCDSQAEENVINLLSQELDTLESIYMVSHKELPIGYDKQLVVIKNKEGLSRVSSM